MKSSLRLGIIIALFIPCCLLAQNNTDTTAKSNNIVNDTTIFEKVDSQASFPGGDIAWRRYIQKSLQGFNPADNGARAGTYTVRAQFVVDKEGNISDVKALTHYGSGMEQIVIDIIKNGPKWNPALLNGQPVKAYRKQPVTFIVQVE